MAITEWEIRRTAIGQSNIRIILCDDDPVFLNELRCEIERTFAKLNMKVALSAFNSPAELTPELLAACDMAFLDIDFEREDQNGIDLARTLRQVNSRARLFFVTNYVDYAPTGYEVQAFRYILKRDMHEVLERYILQAMENLAEAKEYLQLRDNEVLIDLPLVQVSLRALYARSAAVIHGQGVLGCLYLSRGRSQTAESHAEGSDDEPIGNFDPKNREIIMNLLRHEHERGRGIILITHDMEIAKQSDTVYQREGGKLHIS